VLCDKEWVMIKFNTFNYSNVPFAQNSSSQKDTQSNAKQKLIDKNYNEIYTHELAHKMAGGSLAGGIVIERNSDGIPVSGHVPIKMPALNSENPQKTIEDADTVIRSAMAPSDPSSQDYNVASKARTIRSEAVSLKNKKLNYIA